MKQTPRILSRAKTRLSAWSSVTERRVMLPGKTSAEAYHSLSQSDYVSVVAKTEDGRVPLVRQYRPALEQFTLELPGGLCDANETAEVSAMRELFEETGLEPITSAVKLGNLSPDTGRLENRLWGFAVTVRSVAQDGWEAEPGVEPLLVTPEILAEWIRSGEFDHALHIALIALAQLKGFLSLS